MIPAITNLEQIADRLLLRIRRKPRKPVAVKALEKSLDLDHVTINTAARLLSFYDYRLKICGDSITFLSAPDKLIANEITYGLKTKWLGQNAVSYKAVKSTNDLAIETAERGARHGTIVTAEQQSRGRGRFSRSWYSPPGTGIYISVILRPRFKPERAPGLSIMTAVALADTTAQYCPKRVRIKWPNDLLIGGKKVAGILTELSAERNRIHHVIIGVGINVNHGIGSFPEEIRGIATSLRRATRRKINRVEFLQRFLVNLETEFERYSRHGLRKALPRVRRYSSLIGREVRVKVGRNITTGRAVDIAPDGSLLIESEGVSKAITAGEVTIVKH